ncbi:coiled-coil domain-containing protein 171-like isoform X2 [Trichomycterus rosablanca]|uniref:coiled-coil domain-containing protein 171-like isoform X2 n=1 Tax=Trichomycterus rosablanca TaxID=2290929 RepID=UPI002F357426
MSAGPAVSGPTQGNHERSRDRTKRKGGGQSKAPPRSSQRHTANRSNQGIVEEINRLTEVTDQLQNKEQGINKEEELRWRINLLEKEKLEVTSKCNQEVACSEAQLARCRALLERGEAQRQTLEYELAVMKRDAAAQNKRLEDKIADLIKHNQQLEGLSAELRQRASDLLKALEITQLARNEDEQRVHVELRERDHLIYSINTEKEQIQEEKRQLDTLLQEQKDTLQDLRDRMDRVQKERQRDAEQLRVKTSELRHSVDREEKVRKEVKAVMQRVKTLEESVESERAAHMELKVNAEVLQVRLKDAEAALSIEKKNQSDASISLELLKQKFGELEKAHTHEKERANTSQHALQQLEKEHLHTKSDLTGQLDKMKNASADLVGQLEREKAESANLMSQLEKGKAESSNLMDQLKSEKAESAMLMNHLEEEKAKSTKLILRLQECERAQTESQQEVSLNQQRLLFLEEAYKSLLKDMEQLLERYHQQGAPHNNSAGVEDKRSPSTLMDSLRATLHQYHTETKDLLKVVNVLNEESKEKENIITQQKRHIQDCEVQVACLREESERLRANAADASAATDRAQRELHRITYCLEKEKKELADTTTHMHILTQEHKKEQQEQLTFLHSLYQRLVAGYVFVAPAQDMIGSFSWAELSAMLQEHADALASDFKSMNQKISLLESMCEGKAAALTSVCEQLKQREESWIKQREELDSHHTRLVNELHTKSQDLRSRLNQAEESLRVSEHSQSALHLEVNRLQDLIHARRRDDESLLATCALLAGCVSHLHTRVCALKDQKAVLHRCVRDTEALKGEVSALLHALSNPEVKGHAAVRQGVWRFRSCAIAVMAAVRLRTLHKTSHTLFRLDGGVCVKELRLSEGSERRDEEAKMSMLRSSELSAIIHSCMHGVQKELGKTEHTVSALASARVSFTKLMERLLPESESLHQGCYGGVGTLAWQLGQGLNRLRKINHFPLRIDTNKLMLSALQQHFLAYTKRLHSAEVERRDLRIELARLRCSKMQHSSKSKDGTNSQREPKNNNHRACVPIEQFRSVCSELSSALQREQQAQSLLHEQATQLHELGLTMELHTGEQLEKDHTLAQAVQSLTKAKAELKRKDQSLCLFEKQLRQSHQENQQLQETIKRAEESLRISSK